MSKVFLFVEVNVKPGKMDEFVNKIKAHAAVIRTEAGCEFLDIYRNTQKSDVFYHFRHYSPQHAELCY